MPALTDCSMPAVAGHTVPVLLCRTCCFFPSNGRTHCSTSAALKFFWTCVALKLVDDDDDDDDDEVTVSTHFVHLPSDGQVEMP